MSSAQAPVAATGRSVVTLHRLASRADRDDTVVVGRIDTGSFVAIPDVGARIISLLAGGATVGAVAAQVSSETGDDFEVPDIAEFVEDLVGLGFVASIDGVELPGPPVPRSSLERLKPSHVRWLVSPKVHCLFALIIGSAVVAAVVRHTPPPSYRDLLWTTTGSLVLVTQLVTGWTLIFIHELAHLATARAAGVPGRIELSTRLHFLVAQTDVTGIWAATRRQRLIVYSAGMASDATIGAVAFLTSLSVAPGGAAYWAAKVIAATVTMAVPLQFLIFMRTDVYFILQELTGCRNLYTDGTAYVWYQVRRAFRKRSARRREADPTRDLPPAEQHTVRWYALLLVAGTLVFLAVALNTTLPFELHLLAGGVGALFSGRWPRIVDGVTVLAVLCAIHAFWCVAWWRRHGPKIRRMRAARGSVLDT
ncbi:PqqD family protein [Kitasatospora sp. NPDC127060]|uniref:PqqD family protein n=1 Tax=Kitasatospora sp. NPDC127060 TaxID=3347121 RepID=UPI00365BB627